MRGFIAGVVGMLVLVGGGQLHAATMQWNVNSDYGIANGNPNGAWSYGMVNNSVFQRYTLRLDNGHVRNWYGNLSDDGAPLVGFNYGAWLDGVDTGQFYMHPGPNGQASVARWTAPAGIASPVQVQGQFLPGDIGAMEVGIFVNGIPQVTAPYWHSTDSGAFNFSLPVSAGNTIDFAVYDNYSYGSTPLEATITGAPEPSTLALLGVGAVGLLGFAWRRRRWASMTSELDQFRATCRPQTEGDVR
jgi:hypothetical protein